MSDSIAALSSPPGNSGLAVIRLSGPACSHAVQLCLENTPWKPRVLHKTNFHNPENGEILDTLAFHFLPGPASPTGEDMLEIFPHGNPLLVEFILDALLLVPNVRLAEPGEFTRRALENGKIDLLQAEAVGELIHAETRAALRNAGRILQGELSEKLGKLRNMLIDLSARLELDVDFAEEEADPDFASWLTRIQNARHEVENLLQGFEKGRSFRHSPRAVVFGAPNAGKSSLINSLLARNRLLVSEFAGTTRDFVEVSLRLPGGAITLVDTAGLGVPADGLDAQAMDRSRTQVHNAVFRVFVADGTAPVKEMNEADLRVSTKSDLPRFIPRPGFLPVSNRTGEGIQELLDVLEQKLFSPMDPGSGETVAVTERQRLALLKAKDRLFAAENNLKNLPAVEIIAFELREACQAMRELLGDFTPEDVLHRVFSAFCIGK